MSPSSSSLVVQEFNLGVGRDLGDGLDQPVPGGDVGVGVVPGAGAGVLSWLPRACSTRCICIRPSGEFHAGLGERGLVSRWLISAIEYIHP